MSSALLLPVFLVGVILGYFLKAFIDTRRKYGGVIRVTKTDDKTTFMLELNTDPNDLETMEEVFFKVVPNRNENIA